MRRLTLVFLGAYIALTAYMYVRSSLGLPFQLWAGFVHPLLALGFVLLHAGKREGWPRALLLIGLVSFLTLLSEIVGVAAGWPFGRYHYTNRLGPLFLGLVPYVIPIVWLNMVYPSYVMAARLIPSRLGRWGRILAVAALGGVIVTSWDLVVDPVMAQRGHWVWDVEGAYFGIPLTNFFGWWLTTFLILLLYLWLSRKIKEPPKSALHLENTLLEFDRLAMIIYAVTGLGNIFGALFSGLIGPAIVGMLAMGVWVVFGWGRI